MERNQAVEIPIICESQQCANYGRVINIVSELTTNDLDLFYEDYNGTEPADYCPLCKKLGVAENAAYV